MTQPASVQVRERFYRPDAGDKVRGRALYVADLDVPGAWIGAVLRSPLPCARLLGWNRDPSFDWSRVAVVFAEDIPGDNVVAQIVDDQPLLVEREIRHVGEPLALLAAPDRELLRAALDALTPRLEAAPAQLDADESQDSLHEILIERGDIQRALQRAEHVIEAEYRTDSQEQMYIEPQGFVGFPADEKGVLSVIGSLQCPHYVQAALCRAFAIEPHLARVRQATTGGGFGGKEDYPSILACHVALLAQAAKHPVKLIFDRHEDLAVTPKRHPSRVTHRTAVDGSGRLLAMDIEVQLDGGAYTTLSPVVLSRACIHAAGAYRCDNVRIRGRVKRTNHVPYGAFRGFGAPQVCFAVERQMDRIARELGQHPAEVRRRNRLGFADRTATGQQLLASVGASQVLERALARTGFDRYDWGRGAQKRAEAEAAGSKVVHGRGMSFFFHGTGFTGDGEEKLKGRIAIELQQDGRLLVSSGSSEFGQGTEMMFQTIASETIGSKPDDVVIAPIDTASVPNSGPTVASRTCMIIGGCLERACEQLRERMQQGPAAGEQVEATFRERAIDFLRGGGDAHVEVGYQSPPGLKWDQEHYRGDAYPAYGWAVDVAEVEVDLGSLEVRVTKFTTVADVGRAVQPALVEGQLEGGALQAIGQAHLECVTTEAGRFLQDRMATCIIPTCLDAPPMEVELVEEPFAYGPGGAKGVGELPADGGAAAVVSAIEDALGVTLEHLPASPERIDQALAMSSETQEEQETASNAVSAVSAPSRGPQAAPRGEAASATQAESEPVPEAATIAVNFELNDRPVVVSSPPMARLLDVLREDLGLTGTKEGCGEGECGACTVLVNGRAINSCLVPICQVEGETVQTIEAAGFEREQCAFIEEDGAQCGICTPGMVLATHAWRQDCQRRGIEATAESARIGLSGNLCRCTGYEKIVASAMAAEDSTRVLEDEREQHTAGTAVIAAATSESDDKHDHSSANASQHASGVTPVPCSGRTRFEGIDVHTPSTLADALDALATMPDDFCLFAGGTDLSVELSTGRTVAKRILNLWQLDELRGIREDADGLRIGALSTCADLIESKLTAWTADILVQAARSSGAAQIQNRATLGGNLGTASPAADFAPALIALGAKVRLVSTSGQREVLVEDFLCGYRQTLMEAGELIESVWIPGRGADEGRAFRKVGTRRAQSIAKVVLALSLEFEGEGAARRIRVVRAGAGSVAARTCRLPAFEAAMLGCSPSQPDFRACVEAAARLAAETDVTPMSDVRSTAAYRRRSLRRVLASMTLAASRPELAFQPS